MLSIRAGLVRSALEAGDSRVIRMVCDDHHPSNSSLFTEWSDPNSGVTSFLIDPPSVSRSYGFSHPAANVTADGRHVWVYTAETDELTTALYVADLYSDSFIHVESGSPTNLTPALDVTSGTAYVARGRSVFAYEVEDAFEGDDEFEDSPPRVSRKQVSTFEAFEEGKGRLVSGLTRSVDGDRLCGLVERNGTCCVTSLYLPTGETNVWHSRSTCDDAVRFSPTDPTLVLLARNTNCKHETGTTTGFGTSSVWLAREGLGARPLDALLPSRHRDHWWDPDGAGLWYVEPGTGVGSLDLETGRRRTVWSTPVTSAHATRDGRLLAAVVSKDERERLQVYDSSTGAIVDIVSRFDREYQSERDPLAATDCSRPPLRIAPRFVAGDTLLAHTITVPSRDRPSFALTPVECIESRL